MTLEFIDGPLRNTVQEIPPYIGFRNGPSVHWYRRLDAGRARFVKTTTADMPSDLRGVRVSKWYVIDGHCATRTRFGGDPTNVDHRLAFVEKTPRVLDNGRWASGPKGRGGQDAEKEKCYGFDPLSRKWCDDYLMAAGAILPYEDE